MSKTSQHKKVLLSASLAALLCSCAVGPDFTPPTAPNVTGYTPGDAAPMADNDQDADAQRLIPGGDIPAEWWQLFHSEALNALVEDALKSNPDLEAAQAALRQARENTVAGEGAYYPSLDANFNPTRQKQSNITTSNINSGAYVYNLYTASVNVSYAPDVFGGTRRQVESLQALEDQQRFQLEATYLTLTSNLVAAAIQEASLRGQLAATRETIAVETKELDILRRQQELGEAAGVDVLAQESLLAQAEQTLPPLEKQLAQQRDLLAALAGRFPSDDVTAKFELADLQLPKELPLTLPSKLVEQRPDIRAAEEQLHAASAAIGVAIADMLPQISLTANTGSMALAMGQLFTPGNGFWTLAAGVTQPIFEGGTLLHHKRAADAAYDEAAAQYRSTVISAFQNVADTLHALDADAKALKAAAHAEHTASRSLDIVRKQLALGEIDRLALLTSEQSWQQAKISLVQAQANRYTDTAALFQALGGGWWNRDDVKTDNKTDADQKPATPIVSAD
jgi:NodT family efflux transporter outer membrane factor (OMF) lipoprotein